MRLLFITIITVIFAGCKSKNDITFSEPIVISSDVKSGCAYFTKDHRGNPVLCWTEGEAGNGSLFFSVFDNAKKTFGNPIPIRPSTGTGFHNESMNKVAFKSDGTIVAVYEKKHPTENNKYAGSIRYTQSFDNGSTWTKEKFLHTDTLPVYSRSFFDIATLPDGEIGAVWLDGRLKLGKAGSSLFFAKTKKQDGFQRDYQIGETVCECCRTDLYVDNGNEVHIIFRDIESTIEGQIRDLAHIASSDNGVTFSKHGKVSNDKWIIEGCPHSGASMTSTNGQLAVAWFTAGGSPGLYFTQSLDDKKFRQRELLSGNARHPQITTNKLGVLAVWDEYASDNHGHHGDGHSSHQVQTAERIAFAIRHENTWNSWVIPDTEGGEFPVIQSLRGSNVLVAYTHQDAVVYRIVEVMK